MKETIEKKKIRPVGELFTASYATYKENFKKYAYLFILPVILTVLTAIINKSGSVGFYFLFAFATTIISIIVGVILYQLIVDESKPSSRDSYLKARKLIWPFIWLSIIAALITLGGFFLLIVPGIIFAVWFNFSKFIIFDEKKTGTNALVRSIQLVRNYWWAVFGRMLALGVVIGVVGAIFREFDRASGGTIFNLIYSAGVTFLAPFLALYTYNIYKDLKQIKSNEKTQAASGKTKTWMTVVGVWGVVAPIIALVILGAIFFKIIRDNPTFLQQIQNSTQNS